MDLNADGHIDIVTGQYNPGILTFFRGTKNGFLDAFVIKEEVDPKAQPQWFSSCSFADLDGDGDYDIVFGGGGGIRVNYNRGTKMRPQFGKRELLLDTEGNPLVIRPQSEMSDAQIKQVEASYRRMGRTYHRNPAKAFKTTPTAVDWDGDGVLDLLVTDYYMASGQAGVTFFKGVTGGRFQKGVPLLGDEKWIVGSAPLIHVTDWNEDGKPDLLVGTSIATVDGKYAKSINEGFEGDHGLRAGPGKDASAAYDTADLKGKYFRHSGYIYVRYGK